MSWVVSLKDDEGSHIDIEKKFNTFEEALEGINTILQFFEEKQKGQWTIEKESDDPPGYTIISNKNPLIRLNLMVFEVLEV